MTMPTLLLLAFLTAAPALLPPGPQGTPLLQTLAAAHSCQQWAALAEAMAVDRAAGVSLDGALALLHIAWRGQFKALARGEALARLMYRWPLGTLTPAEIRAAMAEGCAR